MDKTKLAETVKAAQNGEDKALETLYLEYAKRTYYLALKIMRNKEDAEDITQEVFITVCQKIGELKEPEAFGLWLNRITANKCTNAFKKKSRFTEQDITEFDETEFADFLTETDPLLLPEKSLDDAETTRMIVEIIDALPDAQRLCVYYYYFEQMTIAQIAEVLETNENTVKKRLYLARDKIRKELERLNKEEGTKLYSFAPLMLTPILKSSLQNFEMPNTQGIWNSVVAASAVKGAIIMGIKAKIAIGVTGFLLVVGVIIAVVIGGSGNDVSAPARNDSWGSNNQNQSDSNNQGSIGGNDHDNNDNTINATLESITLRIDNKNLALPCTLQELLDFGFVFEFDGAKENRDAVGGTWSISDEDKITEKPLLEPKEVFGSTLKLYYNGNANDSVSIQIRNVSDESISTYEALTDLVILGSTGSNYIQDNKISLNGVRLGMEISEIRNAFGDKYTDLTEENPGEMVLIIYDVEMNGFQIREATFQANKALLPVSDGNLAAAVWVNINPKT